MLVITEDSFLTLFVFIDSQNIYSQIRCIALRVLRTSKEFWVLLFRQSS